METHARRLVGGDKLDDVDRQRQAVQGENHPSEERPRPHRDQTHGCDQGHAQPYEERQEVFCAEDDNDHQYRSPDRCQQEYTACEHPGHAFQQFQSLIFGRIHRFVLKNAWARAVPIRLVMNTNAPGKVYIIGLLLNILFCGCSAAA